MPRGSSIEAAREMVSEVDKKGEGRVDYAEVRCLLCVAASVVSALIEESTATDVKLDSCSMTHNCCGLLQNLPPHLSAHSLYYFRSAPARSSTR